MGEQDIKETLNKADKAAGKIANIAAGGGATGKAAEVAVDKGLKVVRMLLIGLFVFMFFVCVLIANLPELIFSQLGFADAQNYMEEFEGVEYQTISDAIVKDDFYGTTVDETIDKVIQDKFATIQSQAADAFEEAVEEDNKQGIFVDNMDGIPHCAEDAGRYPVADGTYGRGLCLSDDEVTGELIENKNDYEDFWTDKKYQEAFSYIIQDNSKKQILTKITTGDINADVKKRVSKTIANEIDSIPANELFYFEITADVHETHHLETQTVSVTTYDDRGFPNGSKTVTVLVPVNTTHKTYYVNYYFNLQVESQSDYSGCEYIKILNEENLNNTIHILKKLQDGESYGESLKEAWESKIEIYTQQQASATNVVQKVATGYIISETNEAYTNQLVGNAFKTMWEAAYAWIRGRTRIEGFKGNHGNFNLESFTTDAGKDVGDGLKTSHRTFVEENNKKINTLVGEDAYSIYIFLTQNGLTDEGACAVLGNLATESSTFDPNAINGDHYGIAQWGSNRKVALLTKENYNTLEGQLDFLIEEMTGSYYPIGNYLKETADLREATFAVMKYYEGCVRYSNQTEDCDASSKMFILGYNTKKDTQGFVYTKLKDGTDAFQGQENRIYYANLYYTQFVVNKTFGTLTEEQISVYTSQITDAQKRGAVRWALEQVGKPYCMNGGCRMSGGICFDCSSLISSAWDYGGRVKIGGGAGATCSSIITEARGGDSKYILLGTKLTASMELEPGDIILYKKSGSEKPATHIVMYIGNGNIVSASGDGNCKGSLACLSKAYGEVKIKDKMYRSDTVAIYRLRTDGIEAEDEETTSSNSGTAIAAVATTFATSTPVLYNNGTGEPASALTNSPQTIAYVNQIKAKNPNDKQFASCDRGVYAVIQASGVDPAFPCTSSQSQTDFAKFTAIQLQHVQGSDKWEYVGNTKSGATPQAGDVCFCIGEDGSPGHVLICLGGSTWYEANNYGGSQASYLPHITTQTSGYDYASLFSIDIYRAK